MNRFKEMLGGLRPFDFCCLGGYALFLAFGYMAFESSTVLSSGGGIDVQAVSLFAIFVLGGRLLVLLAIAPLSARFPAMRPLRPIVIAAALGLVGFLVLGMLLQFSGLLPQEAILPWLGMSGALLGAAAAIGGLVWARFVSTLGLRTAYLFVVLSNITSLPVYFVITLLPASAHAPLCCALFVAAVAFAKPCIEMRGDASQKPTFRREAMREAWKRLWRPVLGTCLLSFMSGFMFQIALWHPIPLDVFQGTSLITQMIVMAALLLPALFVKRPIALASVYKVALPLSALGFLLLPVIWTDAGGLSNACAQLGTLVAGIILWCMLADCVRETKLPSAALFASTLACTTAAQMVGSLLGYFGRFTLAPGHIAVTAVALSAIYAVAMASMFLFKDRSFKGVVEPERPQGGEEEAQPEANAPSELDMMQARCDAIAERAHLTPREREIFEYVGRGRTVSAIAQELVVSENTVKFHMKGIYQKLDVHSRAEVMDLIDRDR